MLWLIFIPCSCHESWNARLSWNFSRFHKYFHPWKHVTPHRNGEYSDFLSSYMDLTRQQCSFPGKECVLRPTALMVCSMHGHKSPRASQCFLSSRLLRLCPLSLSCTIIRQQNGRQENNYGLTRWVQSDLCSSATGRSQDQDGRPPHGRPPPPPSQPESGSSTTWSPAREGAPAYASTTGIFVNGKTKNIPLTADVNLENVISKTIVPKTSL